jgi:hypothetical protein
MLILRDASDVFSRLEASILMNPPALDPPATENRREFVRQAAAAVTLSASALTLPVREAASSAAESPWFRRCLRWGQTNLTEIDPERFDLAWWREYWKRTQVQGVIVNAGGIYAYYPSRFTLHHRAARLGNRDLYGEIARAAHEDGLAVLARMDSSRAREDLYRAHPDWFARDLEGNAYRAGEHYITCVSGPYYQEYLPGILREIIERTHPEGFTLG